MARKFHIPVLGWTPQRLLITFAIVAVVVAVIWRVAALRKLVTGVA